ncbi:uncharacterized protein LOC106173536 [Lingula anatina]|uniref:Uncharacterized protein LOC106173536 n=1 Tax=Lingula anatina TaxID=7574 RepID=A0A1S3JIF5_LINAN|nr:uncharacterized protein LOC106173536 [Lingula anatina]|eukprot:XP_013410148.1 uncharacterized protein LOC106173536 [Lingula anatina]
MHNNTPPMITGPPTTSYAQVVQQSCNQGQTTENSLASSQSRQEELPSRSPTGQLHEITDVLVKNGDQIQTRIDKSGPNQNDPALTSSFKATGQLQQDEPTRIAEQRDKPPKINEDSNVSFEDSWPPTVLHKQFIIQIPDVVGQLEGVVLKSDLPELSDTNLHQIEENSNIWTSYEIPVPINKEEICYSYEIKCKVGWKVWKNKVVTESRTRKVRPCIKQRDVFILPDISKSAQRQDQFNGKLCLFENMLADRTETKQCLIECEEMDFPGNLSREESGELCKWTMHFIEKHEKHKYSTGKILVAYLVAVRSLKYSQSSRKLLDNRSAMLIIGKLKSCTVADIPESYMGMVERLAVELCQLAFSNKSTLLHLIDNFNHLLGMETIINIISSRGGEFCSPFDTTENKKLFETVMSRLTASDVAPRHLKCLFEKLISQCVSPLDLLFFKDECIGWSCDESLINDCMKLTRTRMVIALKEFTKQNYSPEKLKEVFNLWCKVRDDDMICNPEIQCIFEDSIFRKLQSQRVADTIWKDDTAEKLQAFIMESKVFLCEEKGYDMLLLLSKSKHQCLHALVPSILATDKFTRLSQDKLEKVTQTWLKMASEHHSKTKAGPLSKPSDRILYIYQYLLQAIEVPSVKTCVTMTEDLEAFVKGIIRQIGISSVLDKAHKMDNLPDHAQSLFREHVKDIIRADSSDSGASLETIIKGLKGSDMHLYINRSSA